ncbi:DUF6894 family protein [Methylobacterium gnaphalii]|uniref:DUF6894 domain-containing protein n=1 Tax=Methylobacterium gnaphalii TaxID=1010610 RepID=A0A512JNT6_9HYPH|nr:hypothetical protein [Methylobacterium gnaphalii]GEP11621.1 hypothetical protein MGN01_34660 [Methylobacterium gnaphalii]GJD69576.1 hypothetical protein MMMDOFMJ_2513 [Methylobacterium gnaphalii]GLS49116.1 hypothetical protein GCM10007885_19640 [Methylobacterium gnaphalii]
MPSRFRFDLESSHDHISDLVGAEASDINQATVLAIDAIREIQQEDAFESGVSDWELVIRDDAGTELRRLALVQPMLQRAS